MDKSVRKHALDQFNKIDRQYGIVARWWVENLHMSRRHIQRLRKKLHLPLGKFAVRILNVIEKIETGELVPYDWDVDAKQKVHARKTRWDEFCTKRAVSTKCKVRTYKYMYYAPSNACNSNCLGGRVEYYPTKEHAVLRFNEIAKEHYGSDAILAKGIPEIPKYTCEKCGLVSEFVFCVNDFPKGHWHLQDFTRRFFCSKCNPFKSWRICIEFYKERNL